MPVERQDEDDRMTSTTGMAAIVMTRMARKRSTASVPSSPA